MEEEVPVNRSDILVLVAVSLVGGFLIAAWLLPPDLSAQFAYAVIVGAVMLSFFLFIPIMGARLFIDDWRDDR